MVCSIPQAQNQSKNYHRQNRTICIIFIRNYHHQNSHFHQTVKAVHPFPSVGGARSCNCPDACRPQVLQWLYKFNPNFERNTSTNLVKNSPAIVELLADLGSLMVVQNSNTKFETNTNINTNLIKNSRQAIVEVLAHLRFLNWFTDTNTNTNLLENSLAIVQCPEACRPQVAT